MSRRVAAILVLALLPASTGLTLLLHTHGDDHQGACDAAGCQICFLVSVVVTAIVVSLTLFLAGLNPRPAAPITRPTGAVVFDRLASISPRAPPVR